jgi:4'-phosphopantetheinyl transferase EntD
LLPIRDLVSNVAAVDLWPAGRGPADGGARIVPVTIGLQALFPGSVVAVEATEAMWDAPLAEEEARFVARAVSRRRREFQAGRACARAALGALGLPPRPIPVGPDRAPIWPHGFVGSITHTSGLCAAAVARGEDFLGLGIDAEQRGRVSGELVAEVCTEEERSWLAAGGDADAPTLVFSAKEALYKALHPLLGGAILGFHDASLPCAPRQGVFWIALARARRPVALPPRIEGRFRLEGDHVVTAIALPASL